MGLDKQILIHTAMVLPTAKVGSQYQKEKKEKVRINSKSLARCL